ncbi:MAG: type I-C CRISPR-associated protein Cas5c [Eubacteriales bacterium]|nr:type I-C CRISPR-associated protein Cas5c [Eubacteriales bacterium]
MSYGFKIMIEGDYACFTRPEMKAERVSYDVPTPCALEGLLKSVYWKPAIRYVIDKIIIFNPINFTNIRKNEIKTKLKINKVKDMISGKKKDISIYADEERTQKVSTILKNVKYGVEFHFEMTGISSENEDEKEEKHYNIIKRRLEKGQQFRTPCLGLREFPVKKIELVNDFDLSLIDDKIKSKEIDLGYMSYRINFCEDKLDKVWEKSIFSDKAKTEYYRPKVVQGVIDVALYREEIKC